ncbi:hypothetical protein [Serratia marcescens]|uniref:hypothetical protein n=1 Tax=Serratia marcescens TaxID=615 RepID=UPI0029CBC97F|nr:hypothetical protein [Serratia marcescens]
MSFVIDADEWDFNGLTEEQFHYRIDNILERIAVARERNENVLVGNTLQSRSVFKNMDLWSFLFDPPEFEISQEIKEELTSFFNTVEYYEDNSQSWPPGFLEHDVLSNSGEKLGLDLSFIYFNIQDRQPFACLTFNSLDSIEAISSNKKIIIPYVRDECSHRGFWQNYALEIMRDTQENFQFLSPHAYPDIFFRDEVWGQLHDFDGGYNSVKAQLKKYLSALDSYGAWVFNTPPPLLNPQDTAIPIVEQTPSKQLIQERFQGLALNISPENPNVYEHRPSREAREIVLEGKKLYCEWHAKLELHRNRVHIHPPLQESNGKVIVAIFHRHLPLP